MRVPREDGKVRRHVENQLIGRPRHKEHHLTVLRGTGYERLRPSRKSLSA